MINNPFTKYPKTTRIIGGIVILGAVGIFIGFLDLAKKAVKNSDFGCAQIWTLFGTAPKNIFDLPDFNFVFDKPYRSFKEISEYFLSAQGHTSANNEIFVNSFNNYIREYLEKLPLNSRTLEMNKFLELSNQYPHNLLKWEEYDLIYTATGMVTFFALTITAMLAIIASFSPKYTLEDQKTTGINPSPNPVITD